jgi:predicted GNAT family N-acyltransferase
VTTLAPNDFVQVHLSFGGSSSVADGSMKHCLTIVDEDLRPVYLDSPNPRNISFYERHGFEVTGEARAGACPPVVSMLRAAR